MIYRLAGSRFTLLLINFSILIGTAGMVTMQVEFLTTNYQLNWELYTILAIAQEFLHP